MNKTQLGNAILRASTGAMLEADEQKALAMEVLRLKEIISEVHSWIVCGCITSAEDMMGNGERICEITGPDFDGEACPPMVERFQTTAVITRTLSGEMLLSMKYPNLAPKGGL